MILGGVGVDVVGAGGYQPGMCWGSWDASPGGVD